MIVISDIQQSNDYASKFCLASCIIYINPLPTNSCSDLPYTAWMDHSCTRLPLHFSSPINLPCIHSMNALRSKPICN